MKKTVAYIVLAIAAQANAQTNAPIDNFTLVTNLWWNGYKTNVLQIAEQRLAANSNDLAGLVMKLEYDLEFSHDSLLSNDIFKIIHAASQVTNLVISSNYSNMKYILEDFLDYFEKDYHPTEAELLEEKAKADIIHKRMTYERYLKWLRADDLF